MVYNSAYNPQDKSNIINVDNAIIQGKKHYVICGRHVKKKSRSTGKKYRA